MLATKAALNYQFKCLPTI